ncbi:uncharacterized protein LOC134851061 isoform X2 [Symsagittifera roscoffensis]|uniref:uncharacterized protein LOC134851061 isoform X2 n=1 Tax=Symsagittifera roscoffensis TaxID=84072 RepID=UPI00307C263D
MPDSSAECETIFPKQKDYLSPTRNLGSPGERSCGEQLDIIYYGGRSDFVVHFESYPHFIPVMEIFAIALQERQKTWKLREQFSKFDLLAEDSSELSTYLTSGNAKRRRQAFNHQSRRQFYSVAGSSTPKSSGLNQHQQSNLLNQNSAQNQQHQAGGSSSGGSNATTISDESTSNCSFDHVPSCSSPSTTTTNHNTTTSSSANKTTSEKVMTSQMNASASSGGTGGGGLFGHPRYHHHQLTVFQQLPDLSRSVDNKMEIGPSSSTGPTRPTNKINGSFQSPINLTSSEAVHDPQLLEVPLIAHYQLTRDFELINTGYVLQLSMRPRQMASTTSEFNLYDYSNGGFAHPHLAPSDSKMGGLGMGLGLGLGGESILVGGPLETGNEFQLIDIIFHWGKETDRGSEHTVNFKAYPMEVQLVHWNCTLYSSYEEALGKPKGICICALFVQIGREHSTLKMIIDHIEEVQFRGRSKRITTALSPASFLPDPALRDYWVYSGSLTIPPCHENVTWILYRYPLTISHSQLEEFRRLKTFTRGEAPTAGYEGQMVDNFRPTQALCDRRITSSFKP